MGKNCKYFQKVTEMQVADYRVSIMLICCTFVTRPVTQPPPYQAHIEAFAHIHEGLKIGICSGQRVLQPRTTHKFLTRRICLIKEQCVRSRQT